MPGFLWWGLAPTAGEYRQEGRDLEEAGLCLLVALLGGRRPLSLDPLVEDSFILDGEGVFPGFGNLRCGVDLARFLKGLEVTLVQGSSLLPAFLGLSCFPLEVDVVCLCALSRCSAPCGGLWTAELGS